jgi:BirA family biotin operon repressor/biotin-[acetyl-CoA-carboxylase] ligase
MLNEKCIKELLSVPAEISLLKIADSTNTILKEEAKTTPHPHRVIIAEKQTLGRGRLGRSFHSPSQSGIYMSLLAKPEKEDIGLLTAFTAVAVCNALEKVSSEKFGIKWVNDIYKNGKKVCGILAEAGATEGELKYVIVGIGINVYAPEDGFPKDIENIAGSVFDHPNPNENGEDLRNRIISEIINNFYSYTPDFVSEYIKKSCVIGKNITVHQGNSAKKAFVLDIDHSCRLIVKYENGDTDCLSFGEISIRLD